MRAFLPLAVLLLLGAVAFASQDNLSADLDRSRASAAAQEEGIFDFFSGLVDKAKSFALKANVVLKKGALVQALKGASPRLTKLGDAAIAKAIENQLEKTAGGMLKAATNTTAPPATGAPKADSPALPSVKAVEMLKIAGTDKAYPGAEKKPKPASEAAFLELEVADDPIATLKKGAKSVADAVGSTVGAAVKAITQAPPAPVDPSDPVANDAKQIMSNPQVTTALKDLADALVGDNPDLAKVGKEAALTDLKDRVYAAVVDLLQSETVGDVSGKAKPATAAAPAAAPAAASPPSPTAAARPRFRRVFEKASTRAGTSFSIELSAKSYIRPVASSGCWVICPDVFGYVVDPVCSGAAIAWCGTMGPMGVVSNSEAYGPGGNFRLYSKVKFNLQCDGGKVTSVSVDSKVGAVGKEGPLQGQPPNGDYDRMVAKVDSEGGHIGYMFSGRPHGAAEVGFQALRLRTCTYIWHFPYFKITSCGNDGSWNGKYQFGGSNFPTRRLWRDGTELTTIFQGRIDALWSPSSKDRALVDGWFPFNYPY